MTPEELISEWDSDFTKVTPQERAEIEHAEQSGFIKIYLQDYFRKLQFQNLSKLDIYY